MNQIKTRLYIKQVDLRVNLGWRQKERTTEQAILLDIDIIFSQLPGACKTDDLSQTVCYDQLIQTIRTRLGDRHFRLIEHLTQEIYLITKSLLPASASTIIHLTKFPKVEGLTGGVCFTYGDNDA